MAGPPSLQSHAQACWGRCVLGKKVGRQPPHLVTSGTSGARRTNGASQTSDAIFARRTISTFRTSIALTTWESLRLPGQSKEVSRSTLLASGPLPSSVPACAEDLRSFRGKSVCVGFWWKLG